jgi:transposase-like protein
MKHAGGRKPEALKRRLFAEAFAAGASYGKIGEALGVHRLTAVRWRREMKLPKRLNAGGGYSTGKKADNEF